MKQQLSRETFLGFRGIFWSRKVGPRNPPLWASSVFDCVFWILFGLNELRKWSVYKLTELNPFSFVLWLIFNAKTIHFIQTTLEAVFVQVSTRQKMEVHSDWKGTEEVVHLKSCNGYHSESEFRILPLWLHFEYFQTWTISLRMQAKEHSPMGMSPINRP